MLKSGLAVFLLSIGGRLYTPPAYNVGERIRLMRLWRVFFALRHIFLVVVF